MCVTMLNCVQKVTVFSPDGAYLAVAGSKEVCSPEVLELPDNELDLL